VGFPGGPAGSDRWIGEVSFGVVPDPALPGLCFGGIPFTVVSTSGGGPTEFIGPGLERVALNPVSTNFFEPIPGMLQYFGPPATFVVSFSITLQLLTTDSPTGYADATALLCLNHQPIQSSGAEEGLTPVVTDPDDAVFSFGTLNGQVAVRLQAGDQLDVCLTDLIAQEAPPPITITDTICVNRVSLIAQQV
jgi:hypothetical protein